jgi:hypothetical protein
MLFRETVAVYCENRTEHTNTLCGQTEEIFSVFKRVVHILTTRLYRVNMLYCCRYNVYSGLHLLEQVSRVCTFFLFNA